MYLIIYKKKNMLYTFSSRWQYIPFYSKKIKLVHMIAQNLECIKEEKYHIFERKKIYKRQQFR